MKLKSLSTYPQCDAKLDEVFKVHETFLEPRSVAAFNTEQLK